MKKIYSAIVFEIGGMIKHAYIDLEIIFGSLVALLIITVFLFGLVTVTLSWIMKKTYWFWRIIVGKSFAEHICTKFYQNITNSYSQTGVITSNLVATQQKQ